MKSLIRFSLGQQVLVNITFVALVVIAALWAVPNIPIDRYPNILFGEVRVTTNYPGADPEEVERLVTDVIEESLRGMEQLDFVRSSSIPGQSDIHVKFVDDTDYDALYDELRLRVLGAQNQLPTVNGDPLAPVFTVVEVDEWLPVIQLSLLSADESNPVDLPSLVLLGKELRQRLESGVPGIKKVLVLGDSAREFALAIDRERLEAHGLTLDQVVQALRQSGQAPPAGILEGRAGEALIKIANRFRQPEDLYQVVVRRDGSGSILRVGDLIDPAASGVQLLDSTVIATINGRDAVTCKVLKKPEANAIEIRDQAVAIGEEFLHAHPDAGIELVTTLDGTVQIEDGLGVLVDSLLLSAVLVMALLFLFLDRQRGKRLLIGSLIGLAAAVLVSLVEDRGLKLAAIAIQAAFVMVACRAAVLTVSGIVFSFLVSLLIFHTLGYSINEISLLGFVLVSGIVVDDAIVVLENIQRHREEGEDLLTAVIEGTAEVFWPVTAATLTTLAAFLPMLIMTGPIGEFFSLVPLAVATALAVSLVECLIILPLHVVDSERVLGRDPNVIRHDEPEAHTGLVASIDRVYGRLLRLCLDRPWATVGLVTTLFLIASSALVYSFMAPSLNMKPLVKNQFFPDDTSVVDIRLEMPAGTPQAETDAVVREISTDLAALGEDQVASVTGLCGLMLDQAYRPQFGNQFAMLAVEIPGKARRAYDNVHAFIKDIRARVAAIAAAHDARTETTARQGGPPIGPPVSIRLSGYDDAEILRLADDLIAFLRSEAGPGERLDGLIDLQHDRTRTTTILDFTPDRDALALYGLSEQQAMTFIANAVDGAYVGEYRRIDDDIPIRARLEQSDAGDPVSLAEVPLVDTPDGRLLRFADLGTFSARRMPATLVRRDFQRTITVTGNFTQDAQADASSIQPIVRDWLDENATAYPGTSIAFGGEAESTKKSYASLIFAFGIAIAIIYGILATQFGSYLQPVIIMSNIVFSFTGVVFALAGFGLIAELLPAGVVAVERSYFTVQVFIAVVGLTGLVVNDAIVLMDFINKRRAGGMGLRQALLTAGHQRLRPILMTTATTIAGLLPMAIGIPDFSITWGPFATSFIVGLLFSTSMTLLVVPVLYELIDRLGDTLWSTTRQLLPGNGELPNEAPTREHPARLAQETTP